MKKSTIRDTLRRIQDLVASVTGAPLRGDAEKKLENILSGAIDHTPNSPRDEKFVSREITILLADLRGFSSISETYPAEQVLELLNRYFSRMSEIILRHQGTIDKFMGDSIMVLFDAATTRKDIVRGAVACAVEMQIAMHEANEHNRRSGLPELYMGVGINTGTVMAGLVGSELYSEYTVIGDEVNLASRIEAFSLRGQVLISQSTHDRCRDFVLTGEPLDVYVKGKSGAVSLREVLAIPSLGVEVPRQEIRKSPRVGVKMPFTYRLVVNKIIMPEPQQGGIVDIGYHGVLVELDHMVDAYSEIKLEVPLSLVGYTANDIYGRILRTRPSGNRYLANVEFTTISDASNLKIKQFVQLLIQGSETR
jgi:adenylate cyclase